MAEIFLDLQLIPFYHLYKFVGDIRQGICNVQEVTQSTFCSAAKQCSIVSLLSSLSLDFSNNIGNPSRIGVDLV